MKCDWAKDVDYQAVKLGVAEEYFFSLNRISVAKMLFEVTRRGVYPPEAA